MARLNDVSKVAILGVLVCGGVVLNYRLLNCVPIDADAEADVHVHVNVNVPPKKLPRTFAEVDFVSDEDIQEFPYDIREELQPTNNASPKYECRLVPREKERFESDKTSKDLATLVVFQSNGGYQLQRFLAHHEKVVGMERIVIIDHQSDRRLADSLTEMLLDEYNALGSDVWRCDGPLEQKGEMWTRVMHQYVKSSQFMFPLDVDELIAVKVRAPNDVDKATAVNGVMPQTESLSWNAADFKASLSKLSDAGHMFKTEWGNILPVDCGEYQWNITTNNNGAALRRPTVKYVGRMKSPYLMSKVFFRSKDFYSTDTGNHWGSTHAYRRGKDSYNKIYFPPNGTRSDSKFFDPVMLTDIYVMHFQKVNFEEWLIHAIRGASDILSNKFPPDLVDCESLRTNKNYCKLWNVIVKTGFDPRKLKDIYRKTACSSLVASTDPFPVGHLFEE